VGVYAYDATALHLTLDDVKRKELSVSLLSQHPKLLKEFFDAGGPKVIDVDKIEKNCDGVIDLLLTKAERVIEFIHPVNMSSYSWLVGTELVFAKKD
jgi:hypothetical protein